MWSFVCVCGCTASSWTNALASIHTHSLAHDNNILISFLKLVLYNTYMVCVAREIFPIVVLIRITQWSTRHPWKCTLQRIHTVNSITDAIRPPHWGTVNTSRWYAMRRSPLWAEWGHIADIVRSVCTKPTWVPGVSGRIQVSTHTGNLMPSQSDVAVIDYRIKHICTT